MKYAIFAVCMPEYDVELGAAKIKEWGYDAVEWRVCEITDEMRRKPISYWGKNKTTIDFNNFLENAAKAKQICDKIGLEICALDFDFIYPDKDKAKLAFEGAKLMGVPKARFETARYEKAKGFQRLYDETLDYLATLQQLAKEYGIKALIELRAGTITPSPALLSKVMNNFDPQYLGVTLDPGNMIYEGHMNIDLSLDLIGPYLSHVHVKNSGWKEVNTSADGNVEWQSVSATLLGGIVSWKHVLQQLRERGYDDCLAVEDLSQLRTTEVKLKDDLKVLKIMNKI